MTEMQNEEVVAYTDEDGKLHRHDLDELPENVNLDDILTRTMIENSNMVFFDDFTGKQITV